MFVLEMWARACTRAVSADDGEDAANLTTGALDGSHPGIPCTRTNCISICTDISLTLSLCRPNTHSKRLEDTLLRSNRGVF